MVVVLALGLGGGPAAAAPAEALDCSRTVVDTSGQVDVDRLEAAVADVDPAATVVIRSFDQVPNADLVAAIDEIVVACYGDEDGVRPDVIVLGLSVEDRLSDVLVGSRWGAALSDPDNLRQDVMGTRFATGNYTGGLVAAVEEIERGVTAQLAEGPVTGPRQTELAPAPELEEPPSEPAPGAGQTPLAIGGAVGGIAVCGAAFYLVNRHRRRSTARQQLEKAMAGPTARVGALRERDMRLTGQGEVWSSTTAGRTLVTLKGHQREVENGRMEVDRNVSLLAQVLPDGPAKADEAEIERGQKRVIELSRALDQHDDALDGLAALGAHIDHLRVALPAKQDLLDEEVDEALRLAETRRAEGWSVERPEADLKEVREQVDLLDFDRLELDLLAMSERIESAEARLFAADHELQSLPSRAGSLHKWNAELDKAAELELRRIEDIRRQFSVLAGAHASDSWHWAADHPEQAVENLERAQDIRDAAIALVSEQRFEEAGRQLDAAGMQLIAADHLLDQVDDLVVDLERARQESPVILGQGKDILADLTAFIARHAADLDDSFDAVPAELAGAIEGLEMELRQVKPNYIRVAETGDRINRRIDELLAAAKDQQAETQALRREAARERARAERSVARARRALGWELFQSGDGEALEWLESKLQSLPTDPAAAIEEAGHIADEALRIQERIIARRRRHGTWIATGGGGWTMGGGGWSRGGGGWAGGSRSASGGGRSFGSRSSSGGGRSFGGGRSSGSF